MKNIMEFCRDVLKYKLIKNMGLIKVMNGEEVLEHSYEHSARFFIIIFLVRVSGVSVQFPTQVFFIYEKFKL